MTTARRGTPSAAKASRRRNVSMGPMGAFDVALSVSVRFKEFTPSARFHMAPLFEPATS